MKRNKLYIVGLVLFLLFIPASALASGSFSLFFNDKKIDTDKATGEPVIIEDRTLVPVRVVSESMGFKVDWQEETRKVIIKSDKDIVELEIDNPIAKINDFTCGIDVRDGKTNYKTVPLILDSRTYVPLRFVSEALNVHTKYENIENNHHIYLEQIKALDDPKDAITKIEDNVSLQEVGEKNIFLGNSKYKEFKLIYAKAIEGTLVSSKKGGTRLLDLSTLYDKKEFNSDLSYSPFAVIIDKKTYMKYATGFKDGKPVQYARTMVTVPMLDGNYMALFTHPQTRDERDGTIFDCDEIAFYDDFSTDVYILDIRDFKFSENAYDLGDRSGIQEYL